MAYSRAIAKRARGRFLPTGPIRLMAVGYRFPHRRVQSMVSRRGNYPVDQHDPEPFKENSKSPIPTLPDPSLKGWKIPLHSIDLDFLICSWPR